MINYRAFKMIEDRFSDHIRSFNHHDVTGEDSDAHFWAVRDRLKLAEVALERSPLIKTSTLARSFGDIYSAIKRNLSDAERAEWDRLNDVIGDLTDKYGI